MEQIIIIVLIILIIGLILTLSIKEKFSPSPLKLVGTSLAPSNLPLMDIDVSKVEPTLPKTFRKWYDEGYLSPAQYQGSCNSCWAFATTELLGDRISVLSNKKIQKEMSAQYFISCDPDEGGCITGSTLDSALMHLQTNVGQMGGVPENLTKYFSVDKSVPPCSQIQKLVSGTPLYSFKPGQIYTLSEGQDDMEQTIPPDVLKRNVVRMKKDIMDNGPIAVGYWVYRDLQMMQDFSKPYKHDGVSPLVGGHAVIIVGWDITSDGTEYWIIKNSWSRSWGIDGYYYHVIGDPTSLLEGLAHGGMPNMSLPQFSPGDFQPPKKDDNSSSDNTPSNNNSSSDNTPSNNNSSSNDKKYDLTFLWALFGILGFIILIFIVWAIFSRRRKIRNYFQRRFK